MLGYLKFSFHCHVFYFPKPCFSEAFEGQIATGHTFVGRTKHSSNDKQKFKNSFFLQEMSFRSSYIAAYRNTVTILVDE